MSYCHGYNRRSTRMAVLIVSPHEESLRATVARYLKCCSFAVAALPEAAAIAATMFAFDGLVMTPQLEPPVRERLLQIVGSDRVFAVDDPLLVTRELRWLGHPRRPLAVAAAAAR